MESIIGFVVFLVILSILAYIPYAILSFIFKQIEKKKKSKYDKQTEIKKAANREKRKAAAEKKRIEQERLEKDEEDKYRRRLIEIKRQVPCGFFLVCAESLRCIIYDENLRMPKQSTVINSNYLTLKRLYKEFYPLEYNAFREKDIDKSGHLIFKNINDLHLEELKSLIVISHKFKYHEGEIRSLLRKEEIENKFQEEVLDNEFRSMYLEPFFVFKNEKISYDDKVRVLSQLESFDEYINSDLKKQYKKILLEFPEGSNSFIQKTDKDNLTDRQFWKLCIDSFDEIKDKEEEIQKVKEQQVKRQRISEIVSSLLYTRNKCLANIAPSLLYSRKQKVSDIVESIKYNRGKEIANIVLSVKQPKVQQLNLLLFSILSKKQEEAKQIRSLAIQKYINLQSHVLLDNARCSSREDLDKMISKTLSCKITAIKDLRIARIKKEDVRKEQISISTINADYESEIIKIESDKNEFFKYPKSQLEFELVSLFSGFLNIIKLWMDLRGMDFLNYEEYLCAEKLLYRRAKYKIDKINEEKREEEELRLKEKRLREEEQKERERREQQAKLERERQERIERERREEQARLERERQERIERERHEEQVRLEREYRERIEREKREQQARLNELNYLKSCVSGWYTHTYNGSVKHKWFVDYYSYRDHKDNATSSMWDTWKFVWHFKNDPDATVPTTPYEYKVALDNAVSLVKESLRQTFGNNVSKLTLVCLTASTQLKNELRFKPFAERICQDLNMYNAYSHINITQDAVAKHMGGSGKCEKSYDREWFKDKYIVLFDDVRTSGRSLVSEKNVLESMGAHVICAITLAQTQ